MDVDVDLDGDDETPILPMPQSGGIGTLRDKLHARIAALRRGGGGGRRYDYATGAELGGRDELLEERRRQRAAMRERRRKETKEKIRREEEMKGKKGKDREKDKRENRDKGNITKVRQSELFFYLSQPLNSGYIAAVVGGRGGSWIEAAPAWSTVSTNDCGILSIGRFIVEERPASENDCEPSAGVGAACCAQRKISRDAGGEAEDDRRAREVGEGRGTAGGR